MESALIDTIIHRNDDEDIQTSGRILIQPETPNDTFAFQPHHALVPKWFTMYTLQRRLYVHVLEIVTCNGTIGPQILSAHNALHARQQQIRLSSTIINSRITRITQTGKCSYSSLERFNLLAIPRIPPSCSSVFGMEHIIIILH